MSKQAQAKIVHDPQASTAKGSQRNNIHRQWSKILNHEIIGDNE